MMMTTTSVFTFLLISFHSTTGFILNGNHLRIGHKTNLMEHQLQTRNYPLHLVEYYRNYVSPEWAVGLTPRWFVQGDPVWSPEPSTYWFPHHGSSSSKPCVSVGSTSGPPNGPASVGSATPQGSTAPSKPAKPQGGFQIGSSGSVSLGTTTQGSNGDSSSGGSTENVTSGAEGSNSGFQLGGSGFVSVGGISTPSRPQGSGNTGSSSSSSGTVTGQVGGTPSYQPGSGGFQDAAGNIPNSGDSVSWPPTPTCQCRPNYGNVIGLGEYSYYGPGYISVYGG